MTDLGDNLRIGKAGPRFGKTGSSGRTRHVDATGGREGFLRSGDRRRLVAILLAGAAAGCATQDPGDVPVI
jgi:hypothetical protein